MIRIFENKENLNAELADYFVSKAQQAILDHGKFTVALTGGSSPAGLYQLLATDSYREKIDWSKVYVFWGDERWVPLDDQKSNAGAAFNDLLNHIPVPKDQIFPMWKADISATDYAVEYEALLEQHLTKGEEFDLIILGMGDDGHTASLFPNQDIILKEKVKKVAAYFLATQDMYRITLTAPLINKSKNIVFLVFGHNKAEALYQVLQGEANSNLYPSQLITRDEQKVTWMVDKDAANKLKQ
ncbi:6-phosphogluconolactonase [Galbibacter sp.]|jgi:6-phosphogluconolactonase|uniref:6-phosphogluconolactonase n=1 Tax=Galbibacter sp. TaxID=2918471 RepID=UPI003A94F611